MQKTINKRSDHKVAVIRTEHMWDDIIHLDKLLGGTGEFEARGSKHTHGSEAFGYSVDVSDDNTRFLCCLIWKEIEAYQLMVLKAINLDATEKHMTLSSLFDRCYLDIDSPWKNHSIGKHSAKIKCAKFPWQV